MVRVRSGLQPNLMDRVLDGPIRGKLELFGLVHKIRQKTF